MSSIGAVQGGTSHVYAQQNAAAATTRPAEEQAETAAQKASEAKTSQAGGVDLYG